MHGLNENKVGCNFLEKCVSRSMLVVNLCRDYGHLVKKGGEGEGKVSFKEIGLIIRSTGSRCRREETESSLKG